jgi:hypothetical protein
MKVEGDVLHINKHAAQFAGFIIFMTGLLISLAFRPELANSQEAMNNIEARIAMVGTACSKPQKGEVVVTAKDILDAVRGKPLEFVVKTKVKG